LPLHPPPGQEDEYPGFISDDGDEEEEEELGEGMTIASKIKMDDLAVTQVG
jgi:hypothetical protein